ncbi:putative pentatricopeptide repeat domain-containing protein [Erysiphe neolycopersici]|uniref:Putative pentatricopeptide repeat domain-containing protein n=1 Tax=Erysiphe neolycopersici TaxID=212602 RepID=A0A420HXE2_9PEZI|nr:putative pentatricopeptide repeat domain-containing protein [Erysiphe neolycopersici]
MSIKCNESNINSNPMKLSLPNKNDSVLNENWNENISQDISNTVVQEKSPSLPLLQTVEKNSRKRKIGEIPLIYGLWEHTYWGRDQLESESDLENLQPSNLLYQSHGNEDIQLWGFLLNYRKQAHGLIGIRMFWNATITRGMLLPTSGALAKKIWTTFLELGFTDYNILNQICDYADHIWERHGKRWLLLYVSILEHTLIHEKGKNALSWHRRLFPHHPPGAARFREFFREVVHQKGNLSALKMIYKLSPYRNVYSGVVPLYFKRGQVKEAIDWHLYLIKNNDLPSNARMIEPLIRFLLAYDKPKSDLILKSLAEAGILTCPKTEDQTNNNLKISGELMNIIHGKTFGISVKKYNDELGARWFATSWVHLDTAINAISALGVQEIGPLSLQAIALRDPAINSIIYRIKQLQDLGISLRNSVFIKALEHFAQIGNVEFLEGLLHSDQHPDQLDDFKLQQELLFGYARAHKWSDFYRTLEIQSLSCKNTENYKRNVMLKVLLSNNQIHDAQQMLDHMQNEGNLIKSSSISLIVSRFLQPRRRGCGPCGSNEQLNSSIKLLRDIMFSGNHVPAYHWREIIRRLGMLGRLDHLENLCLSLGRWYLSSRGNVPRIRKFLSEIDANHPKHPTRILFDNNFQRAVVAWGFIHPLKTAYRNGLLKSKQQQQSPFSFEQSPPPPFKLPNITFGINLLRKLQELGIYIDGCIVARAILNRLITYYGPNISTRKYNREAQIIMRGHLMEVIKQIDNALGKSYYQNLNNNDSLPAYLKNLIESKLSKLQRAKIKSCIKKEITPSGRKSV